MSAEPVDLSPDELNAGAPAVDAGEDIAFLVGYLQPGPDDDSVRLYLSASSDDCITINRSDVIGRRRLGDDVGGSAVWVRSSEALRWQPSQTTRDRLDALEGDLAAAVEGGEVSGFAISDEAEVEGYSTFLCGAIGGGIGAGVVTLAGSYAIGHEIGFAKGVEAGKKTEGTAAASGSTRPVSAPATDPTKQHPTR